MNSEITQMRNLGPKCAAALASIGVTTRAQLEELGSVGAFDLVQLQRSRLNIVFLYVLEGALQNRVWHDLSAAERAELRAQVD